MAVKLRRYMLVLSGFVYVVDDMAHPPYDMRRRLSPDRCLDPVHDLLWMPMACGVVQSLAKLSMNYHSHYWSS